MYINICLYWRTGHMLVYIYMHNVHVYVHNIHICVYVALFLAIYIYMYRVLRCRYMNRYTDR